MTNFQEAIGNVAPEIQFLDIDLSVERTKPVRFGISGTTIFADDVAYSLTNTKGDELDPTLEVGVAFVRINEANGRPVLLQGGRLYRLNPFSEIFITNTAQSGKMLRLYYSNGALIQPFSARVDVGGGITVGNLIPPMRTYSREFSRSLTFDTTAGGLRYTLQNDGVGVIGYIKRIEGQLDTATELGIRRDNFSSAPTGLVFNSMHLNDIDRGWSPNTSALQWAGDSPSSGAFNNGQGWLTRQVNANEYFVWDMPADFTVPDGVEVNLETLVGMATVANTLTVWWGEEPN